MRRLWGASSTRFRMDFGHWFISLHFILTFLYHLLRELIEAACEVKYPQNIKHKSPHEEKPNHRIRGLPTQLSRSRPQCTERLRCSRCPNYQGCVVKLGGKYSSVFRYYNYLLFPDWQLTWPAFSETAWLSDLSNVMREWFYSSHLICLHIRSWDSATAITVLSFHGVCSHPFNAFVS